MGKSKFVYVTYIRATRKKIWAALTQPEFTRQYWSGTAQTSDWKTGSSWGIHTPDGRLFDSGEILESDIHRNWCSPGARNAIRRCSPRCMRRASAG
jgi:uncharacterized protein YndB with AHSA1/START domain